MEAPRIVENLFYGMTIIATFNCVLRADFNFAFGLLCYYMMVSARQQENKLH